MSVSYFVRFLSVFYVASLRYRHCVAGRATVRTCRCVWVVGGRGWAGAVEVKQSIRAMKRLH